MKRIKKQDDAALPGDPSPPAGGKKALSPDKQAILYGTSPPGVPRVEPRDEVVDPAIAATMQSLGRTESPPLNIEPPTKAGKANIQTTVEIESTASEPESRPGIIVAAGILFKSPKGTVLFMRRTDGEGWAFPGGAKKDHETLKQCAIRECSEETGYRSGHAGKLLCRRIQNGVDFTTFQYDCDDEFIPRFNHEHDSYVWVNPDYSTGLKLHPGCLIALRKLKGMTELELAEAIRDEELVSPQFVEHVCLVDMRISGTGFSYRPGLNEWVYRRESIYLTPEFLQRCNGIPIIIDHPDSKILDSDEFAKRIVGTMFLPYIKGEDVWGVARIYDQDTIKMITEGRLSTSPSVVFRDPRVNYNIELDDGSNLLVEGRPSFVDHLAICEKGVWDKSGPPTGIRVDSEAVGEAREKVVTAKIDTGQKPEPMTNLVGAGEYPTPNLQSIPPGINDLVTGMGKLTDRLNKIIARKDLMVR